MGTKKDWKIDGLSEWINVDPPVDDYVNPLVWFIVLISATVPLWPAGMCVILGTKEMNRINALRNNLALDVHEPPKKNLTTFRKVIKDSPATTLYHQTTESRANQIISSQTMLRGTDGRAGGGIYFTLQPYQTNNKTRYHGVILKCEVLLGKTKNVQSTWHGGSFEKLAREGYQSVYVSCFPADPEYVVYSKEQVVSIETYS